MKWILTITRDLTRVQRNVQVAEENIVGLEVGVELFVLDIQVLAWDGVLCGVLQEDDGLVLDHCG